MQGFVNTRGELAVNDKWCSFCIGVDKEKSNTL